jgi:hypothetical protein
MLAVTKNTTYSISLKSLLKLQYREFLFSILTYRRYHFFGVVLQHDQAKTMERGKLWRLTDIAIRTILE